MLYITYFCSFSSLPADQVADRLQYPQLDKNGNIYVDKNLFKLIGVQAI